MRGADFSRWLILCLGLIGGSMTGCKEEAKVEIVLTKEQEEAMTKLKAAFQKKRSVQTTLKGVKDAMAPIEQKMLGAEGDKRRFHMDELNNFRARAKKLESELNVIIADIKRYQKKMPDGHRMSYDDPEAESSDE